jgi:hypothetical protein
MKNKKLYKILTILVLIIIFSIALLYMGCKIIRGDAELDEHAQRFGEALTKLREEEEKQAEAEEAEQLAREKQVRLDEAEEAALVWEDAEEAEEEAAPEGEIVEEKNLIPNEPITYSTSMDGAAVILIVNFKTTEVTGSISLSGGIVESIDATINGKIDINTFEITSNYSGIMVVEEAGEYPFNGTITGIITDDLSTFNGEILNDEGKGREITASRK